MGFVSNEVRLNGKGFLDKEYYLSSFEQVFIKENTNAVLYTVPHCKIGKTEILNEFAYITTFTYPYIEDIIWVTSYKMQEHIGNKVIDVNQVQQWKAERTDNRLFIVDDMTLVNPNFAKFMDFLYSHQAKVIGFVI